MDALGRVDVATSPPHHAAVRPSASAVGPRRGPSGLASVGVLLGGVLAISWAAIFVRLAGEAPALTIAAVRVGVGAAVVLATALWWRRRSQGSKVPRIAWWRVAAGGLLLASHFWSWFASLERTTVGSSVMIIGLQPLLGTAMAFLWLGERPTRPELGGMALAMVGLAAIGIGDLEGGREALVGDALALLGALFGAAYRTVGRAARPTLGALEYSAGVYLVAAMALWLLVGLTGTATGSFSAETWAWMAALALVPQAAGHTAMNWALGRFSVASVSLAGQAEPVLATLLAIPILGERPGPSLGIGAPFILCGVALALAGGSAARDGTAPEGAPHVERV